MRVFFAVPVPSGGRKGKIGVRTQGKTKRDEVEEWEEALASRWMSRDHVGA